MDLMDLVVLSHLLNITQAIVAAVANPVTATILDQDRRSRLIATVSQNWFVAMLT